MLHEIAFLFLGCAFPRRHPDDALATAPLRAKRTDRGAFDESAMGDADDASLVPDQIFHGDLALIRHQLSQPRAGVFVANLAQLFFDNGKDALLFCEDVTEIFDRIMKVLVFVIDIYSFKSR